ncbi:MAG: hypothetical protein H0W77_13470 [Acidobacteria bacterium]|nr:hypothetical protein [Acidobacteriota bacterium]
MSATSVSFASYQNRVNRFPIIRHYGRNLIALHQPISRIVFAGKIIVKTVCAAES